MYRRWDPHAMTDEAHIFSHLLLCLHPARPAPMLLETGVYVQMAGFATQSAQHRLCATVSWFCNTAGGATREGNYIAKVI